MAWIESHEELPTHPKTRKVARKLGVSVPTVIGHLHVLWYWCLTHRPDGVLEGMDADDVADAAGWDDDGEPFVKALLLAGWIDDDGGQLVIHDWWDGAGKTIKRRKYATSRQRHARESQETDGPVTDQSPDSHDDVTRDTQAGNGADRDSDRDKNQELSSAVADPEVSQDARDLTRQFAIAVKANGFKVPSDGQKNRAKWLEDMDRLLRLGAPGGEPDPQDPAEVARVIEYATTDSFWKANIGSPSKFREQWPTLRLKMLNQAPVLGRLGTGGVAS